MKKVSKKSPLITVIVPIYKVEEYLDRCIESIINQTYENLEVILVDDGSPDNCPKMCDEWAKKDKRIKVIHKENGGLSDARNRGIENANGKYISFIDSDDWIENNMISTLYKFLVETSSDISTCKLISRKEFIKSENKVEEKSNYKEFSRNEYLLKYFKIGSQETVYYACNKLFKSKLLSNNQFPVGLTSEDVLGTYKAILKADKIVEVDANLYNYFVNSNGITNSKFSIKDFDLIKIWDEVINIATKEDPDNLKYAILNRQRIDYTLLMRMAIKVKHTTIEEKYSKQYKKCLNDLKINKSNLLKSKIPFSRKLTIIMICKNYKIFCMYVNKIYSILRRP